MRNTILKTMYSVGGFRPFHYFNRKELLILTYHRFSNRHDAHKISADQFEKHLEYLKKFTEVISLERAVESISAKKALPPNSTVITIDDGYRDAYEIAYPLLKRYGFPATVFVISDFVDGKIWLWTDYLRYALLQSAKDQIELPGVVNQALGNRGHRMEIAGRLNAYLKTLPDKDKFVKIQEIAASLEVHLPEIPPRDYESLSWDEAREMDRNGVRIECHTVTHPILTNVGPVKLREELESSKAAIGARLGREVDHFCYPNGTYNDEIGKAVGDAGYKSAVTTDYGFCDHETDRFRLRRIDGQPSISRFAQSVSGFERIRERIGI